MIMTRIENKSYNKKFKIWEVQCKWLKIILDIIFLMNQVKLIERKKRNNMIMMILLVMMSSMIEH